MVLPHRSQLQRLRCYYYNNRELKLERKMGLEPTTFCLEGKNSAIELLARLKLWSQLLELNQIILFLLLQISTTRYLLAGLKVFRKLFQNIHISDILNIVLVFHRRNMNSMILHLRLYLFQSLLRIPILVFLYIVYTFSYLLFILKLVDTGGIWTPLSRCKRNVLPLHYPAHYYARYIFLLFWKYIFFAACI